jgi:hypothetical protein
MILTIRSISSMFEDILRKLNAWENKGVRVLKNGTKLICHVPLVAPQAWLHEIYCPLRENEIRKLQAKLGRQLPEEFISFLRITNELNVFSDSLARAG